MKSSSRKAIPQAPVAIKCRCGNRIVLEPRWIGKPTACAECEGDFVVEMVKDPKTRQTYPHVRYTRTLAPSSFKKEAKGGYTWANVVCECGNKIGVEERFFGKNMFCSGCNREFIIRLQPRANSRTSETAVMEFVSEHRAGIGMPAPRKRPPSASHRAVAPSRTRLPSTGRKLSSAELRAVPPTGARAAVPAEMHLLCICGEELIVPSLFYDRNMYCAGCGCLMHLRLVYDEKRRKFELVARVLQNPEEEPS